jgi:hypothetical protein
VEVFVSPGRVYPGQELEVTIGLHSKAPTPTAGTRLTLVGTERARDSESWSSAPFLSLVASFEPKLLDKGKHALRARFALPADMPPTHKAARSVVVYELRVYVDIPWWPDVDKTFEITVSPAPVVAPPTDVVFSSRRGEAVDALYAEMTLATTLVAPGGAIRGALSFTNTPRGKSLKVDAAFIATEGIGYPSETLRYAARIHDGPLGDGVAIPFAISIPSSAPTTFAGRVSRLQWSFNLWVTEGWTKRPLMTIPIQVWPTTGEVGPARLAAVGKSRRAQLWASVGPELGFTYDAPNDELRAESGDVSARVAVEGRADGKSFLVARLAYPWLGMTLSVGKKRWLTGVAGAAIALGHEAFDRTFQITARESAQARALLEGAPAEALVFFSEVYMTDDGATVGSKGAGVDATALRRFLQSVGALLQGLALRLPLVGFPEALASKQPEIEALASRLGGRVLRSAPSILDAERGRRKIEIRFTIMPDAIPPSVIVTTPLQLDPSAAKQPSKRALAASAELQKTGLLTTMDDRLSFTLQPLPEDLASLERDVDAVVDLADLLEMRGGQGPYR